MNELDRLGREILDLIAKHEKNGTHTVAIGFALLGIGVRLIKNSTEDGKGIEMVVEAVRDLWGKSHEDLTAPVPPRAS